MPEINKNEQVIKRILARREGKKDKYKIGLILQGGGMRASFGGGVMTAIAEMGLYDCFDVIYGDSAGSCNGAFFLSRQTKLGAPIYWEELSGFRFIQPWHPSKGMNLDYFCDYILREKRALDVERIKKSPTLFKICVTDKETGRLCFFSNRDEIDLIQAIKASCTYPGFYYPLVKIGDRNYLDGDINRLLPLEEAEKDGCTDILIVATVTSDYRKRQNRLFKFFHFLLVLPLGANLRRVYRNRRKNYNKRLDFVFGRKPFYKQANLYTIYPDYKVKNSENRAKVLKEFAHHGRKKAKEAFRENQELRIRNKES